jgi:hypothetical protein
MPSVTPQYTAATDTMWLALAVFSQAVSSVATIQFDLTHTDTIPMSVAS